MTTHSCNQIQARGPYAYCKGEGSQRRGFLTWSDDAVIDALGRRKRTRARAKGVNVGSKIPQKRAFRVFAAKKGEQNETLSRYDIFEYAMTAAVSLGMPWRSRDTKTIEWNINRAQRDRAVNQEVVLFFFLLSLLSVLLDVSTT